MSICCSVQLYSELPLVLIVKGTWEPSSKELGTFCFTGVLCLLLKFSELFFLCPCVPKKHIARKPTGSFEFCEQGAHPCVNGNSIVIFMSKCTSRSILGDPGAVSGGGEKSKNGRKKFRAKKSSSFLTIFRLFPAPTNCPWVSEDEADHVLYSLFQALGS